VDRVLPSGELAAGRPRRVTVAGSDLLLVRLADDRVVACAAACPHQRTDLEGAAFADGRVRCPLHLYEYELETGENVVPARDLDPLALRKAAPGYLRVHPVEERDGWILVGAEPKPPQIGRAHV
jgi:nitrite reductase/ring-hydroxylating ferredoxin subunit